MVIRNNLNLKVATTDQVREICELVNLGYRGKKGWTRETEIVSGERATETEIKLAIENPDSHLLVYIKNDEFLSCICVEKKMNNAYIGLFVVHPRLQGNGIGKKILKLAEEYASNMLGVDKYVMVVVSQRHELISYYERRGYVLTGETEEYPVHLDVGIPKISGLTIEYLEKNV